MYVNYGNREDYEQLDRLGISVKGAIVIARYGSGWRGIKPKVAGEHGAVGALFIPTRKATAITTATTTPMGAGGREKVCNAAA